MGMKYKQVGGGPATGLAQDYTNFLEQGLNTGTFGPGFAAGGSAMGATQGIGGFLNDILSGGAGKLGGSLQQILQTQQTNDVNSIRSRFGAGGGTAFGTPAAYAESTYRAQAAPQIASAIGNLQLQTLLPLLGQIGGLAQRGIPQAEIVGQQSPWAQVAGIAAPVLGGILGGPAGAGLGAKLGGLFGGGAGAAASNFMPSNINFGAEFNPSIAGGFMPTMTRYTPNSPYFQ